MQNFLSAATGIAVAFALIRGFARHSAAGRSATSGSTSRASTLYILLPLSLVLALFLVGQGVIQNFDARYSRHVQQTASDGSRETQHE